jgi:hypothetical protein
MANLEKCPGRILLEQCDKRVTCARFMVPDGRTAVWWPPFVLGEMCAHYVPHEAAAREPGGLVRAAEGP